MSVLIIAILDLLRRHEELYLINFFLVEVALRLQFLDLLQPLFLVA